jgi:hypothetical protein
MASMRGALGKLLESGLCRLVRRTLAQPRRVNFKRRGAHLPRGMFTWVFISEYASFPVQSIQF